MTDNKNTHKENWLALLLSITYIESKKRFYSCDEALRKLKVKE